MDGVVKAVSLKPSHGVGKLPRDSIRLVEGLGVAGDAHSGEKVKHRSRVRRDPTQPNLRQVHLIHSELHDELSVRGLRVDPGAMGENVTTSGVDLLGLPAGTLLRLGEEAVVEVMGLRNPCVQLNEIHDGLMDATLERAEDGSLIRKAGVMGVVRRGGEVAAGDPIEVELPPVPHSPLEPV
jgi:MOSC domain-containing protein YiiM